MKQSLCQLSRPTGAVHDEGWQDAGLVSRAPEGELEGAVHCDQRRYAATMVSGDCGKPAPTVEKLSATSARITLGEESEVVHLGTTAQPQAAVERTGQLTTLLATGTVKGLAELNFASIQENVDKGGR